MRKKIVLAVFKKEVMELLRDKKAMITMFAIPLIVYPLLIIGILSIATNVSEKYEEDTYRIKIDSSAYNTDIKDIILDNPSQGKGYCFSEQEKGDDADVTISFLDGGYIVTYDSSSERSGRAAEYLSERISQYRQSLIEKAIDEAGMDPVEVLNPISVEYVDSASVEQSTGSVIGKVVPILLLLGVFTGAMTPVVDLTAGEKERGTQETTLSLPTSSTELICGKYLAVALFGTISAALYMVTIGILTLYAKSMMETLGASAAFSEFSLTTFIPSIVMLLIAVLAFDLFISAVLMCICSFAKSAKEATSYCSPLMMVVMLISYVGYLDIKLSPALSIVPVLNIVLLAKSVMVFEYDIPSILLVLASNVAYAALSITLLGKLYTSERVLFGHHYGSLLDRRAVKLEGTQPTVGDGITVLLVSFVLFLYAGSMLQAKYLLPGIGLSQLIIAGVPALAAWFGRVDFKKTFSLYTAKVSHVPPCVLLAFGSFLFFNALCQPLAALVKNSANAYSNTMQIMLDGQNVWIAFLVVALAPAICEEALFRGYVLSSLRSQIKPAGAILISAVLFGIYHLNLVQSVYAFMLGAVMGYVVYRTGSILYSSMIHFLCNSVVVVWTYFEKEISSVLPFLSSATKWQWLVCLLIGLLLCIAGLVWIEHQFDAHTTLERV